MSERTNAHAIGVASMELSFLAFATAKMRDSG
jgi:hypothetical protein